MDFNLGLYGVGGFIAAHSFSFSDNMDSATLHTPFGNARLDAHGYYRVTSRKEGNCGKLLHRLIFEKFYGYLPDDYFIHHKNGNPLDNCILNLQLMDKSEHSKLHGSPENNPWIGREHILSSKIAISKTRNSTGYFRVSKWKAPKYKQGFVWVYRGMEQAKTITIKSADLETLKQKVLAKGLEWREL